MQLFCRLGVCARGDLRSVTDDRHARAEPREDLRELQPDGARADYEQRLRDALELQCRDMVDPADVLDSGDRGHGRAAARRDQDPVGAQLAVADADGLLVDEGRLALDDRVLLAQHLLPALLVAADRVLPRARTREVELGLRHADTAILSLCVDVVHELGPGQIGLRRPAGDVRARSAPAFPLDQRDLRAVLALCLGGAVARRGACAEDDQVEVFDAHAIASLRAVVLLGSLRNSRALPRSVTSRTWPRSSISALECSRG